MKKILLLLLMINASVSFGQNLQLRASVSYNGSQLANIGGYVDTAGNEYALVGTDFGLDIVDVTDPSFPVSRFIVPGANSSWREVKTYRKYAYVTTEGGGGLTVVDLSHLPDTVTYQTYLGDSIIAGQLSTIHALHCDTAKGFLYLYGSNIDFGNTIFLDLTDPWNPTYAGNYIFPGSVNDSYVHDGTVENDTMYEGHIYSGFFTIVDVRDKANPVLLATQETPTAFTHNTWLSSDHRTLFTTDENTGSYLGAYDISDPSNIVEISRFQAAPGSGAVVHNTQIINDYSVTSWYLEGVVIVDEARPHNPIEVGHFDTTPLLSGDGFEGVWGVYPYLPSGTIVASDINNGLFVLTPTYVRGCYLEGVVKDSLTLAVLNNATVEILTTSVTRTSNLSGEYYSGTAVAGTYDVRVSRAGYVTKTISGVSLTNGVLTNLDILLTSLPAYEVSGNVTDTLSGLPMANVKVMLKNADLSYSAITDVNGDYDFPAVIGSTYTMSVGIWGHLTECSGVTISLPATFDFILESGYYDDFTFNYNWAITGSSPNLWERAVPVATFDNNSVLINPAADDAGDCGEYCFVTDNGAAPYNAHDVDNGFTKITSPVFDGTLYVDPVLSYSRYFVNNNGMGQPNDSMIISISNGLSMVRVDVIDSNDQFMGTWRSNSVTISQFISLTDSMQVIVEIMDEQPGHIVEGGFDAFKISGQMTTGIKNEISEKQVFNAYPNPFTSDVIIDYDLNNYSSDAKVFVRDVCGKIVEERSLNSSKGQINIGSRLSAGIYFVELSGSSSVKKIVKQ